MARIFLRCTALALLSLALTAEAQEGASAVGEANLQKRLDSQQQRLKTLEEQVGELRPKGGDGADAEPDPIQFGGALRFNYYATQSDRAQRGRGGDAAFELFRLDIDGEKGGYRFSAEYRWQSYQDVLHHGWGGADIGEEGEVRVGVSQVPFGLLPYAAHNFWFGIPYYTGLADEYDLGIQYLWRPGPWDVRLAFFKNPGAGSPTNHQRYSFDVVHSECEATSSADSADQQNCNRETNQGNLRLAYTLNAGGTCPTEVGLSGQWGQLYNDAADKAGERWAAAGHLDLRCGRWNVQLQGGRQVLDPRTPGGANGDTVTFGALSGSYPVASRANLGVVNIAYNFPAPWRSVDMLTCYNDYSVYDKDDPAFTDSRINTTGCLVGAGPLYIYADHVSAKSAPYLGPDDALGAGGAGWETRYNLNVGYYF